MHATSHKFIALMIMKSQLVVMYGHADSCLKFISILIGLSWSRDLDRNLKVILYHIITGHINLLF
jgi:hypothetical protein